MKNSFKLTSLLLLGIFLLPSCNSTDKEIKTEHSLANPITGKFLRLDDSGNFITSFIIIDVAGKEYSFEQESIEGMEDSDKIIGKEMKVWYDEANSSNYRMILKEGESPTEKIDPSWKKIEGTYTTWATEDDLYAGDMPQDFTINATVTEMTFETYLTEEDLELKGEKVTVYYVPIINRYANKVEVLQ